MDGSCSSGRRFAIVAGLILLTAFVVPRTASAQALPLAGPIIGPERPVSYPVPATPQNGYAPAVAFGASIYLVVWQGGKAARVDQAGTVLDPSPIHLGLPPASLPDTAFQPDIAFDGENFLVVSDSSLQGAGVQGVRVSPNGEVLDASPIVVSDQEDVHPPKVVFDGTNYLVVWGSQAGVNRAVVSPAGIVLGPAALLVSSPGARQLDVAFNGSHHLVTWSYPIHGGAGGAVSGMLVDRSGSALSPGAFPISVSADSQSAPTVASFGPSFLVAWDFHESGGSADDIYASRVDATGSVLDPTGIPIATGPETDLDPEAAFDGTNVLVVWATSPWSSPAARGARVTSSGTVLDPSGFPVSTLNASVAVAFGGTDYFVVGFEQQSIRGSRLTPAGAVLDPVAIPVSIGANEQVSPATASDGTNTLVVWHDNRHGSRVLYGGRVGPNGQVLDGDGFQISHGDYLRGGAVVFDGTNFVVAWTEQESSGEGHAIWMARLSRSGVVLGRSVMASTGPDRVLSVPTLAFGGETLLVAWNETETSRPFDSQLHAALSGPDGIFSVVVAERYFDNFDVAFGSAGFLFVWSSSAGPVSIVGTLVTTSGTVVTPSEFPIAPSVEGYPDQPQVAWNGEQYLVVWTEVTDWSDDARAANVRGARVDGSGTVLDPAGIRISTAPGWKSRPAVAANGSFLVTWFDRRRRGDTDDLYATRIDPDGAVAHPDGFELASSVSSSSSIVPGVGGGTFSVTYVRYLAEQPYGTTRIINRTVNPK